LQGRVCGCRTRCFGAYRLAARLGHDRQIWLKRLATPPAAYPESPCCRAPFLPLLTRDVRETGLICQHCDDTLVPFEEFPADLQTDLGKWAAQYADVHGVAHWDERQRRSCGDYDRAYDEAAKQAERLLGQMGALWHPPVGALSAVFGRITMNAWMSARKTWIGDVRAPLPTD
jgi:hypothetical protein